MVQAIETRSKTECAEFFRADMAGSDFGCLLKGRTTYMIIGSGKAFTFRVCDIGYVEIKDSVLELYYRNVPASEGHRLTFSEYSYCESVFMHITNTIASTNCVSCNS